MNREGSERTRAPGTPPASQPRMDQRDRYARTLSQAEKTLGGRDRLARALNVPAEKIAAWLAGAETPPLQIFLDSLDLIADGPYVRFSRPIRVAAIRSR